MKKLFFLCQLLISFALYSFAETALYRSADKQTQKTLTIVDEYINKKNV